MSTAPIRPQPTQHRIRWMIRKDMPEVLAIEQRAFGDEAWSEDEFIGHLKGRNIIGMVADRDDQVAGYMIYRLERNRLDLLNLAVHPLLHRQGIGRSLVYKLISKLSPQRRNLLRVDVSETNLRAQLFLRACGLTVTEIVRQPYERYDMDAYRFERYETGDA